MSRFALRLLAIANLAAFLVTVIVNGLANALPINGRNTGQISDSLPNLFVPAGLTFSIWGLIYLLLGIWSVWQLVSAMGGNAEGHAVIQRVSLWFLLASAANALWILAWHYLRFLPSLLIMLVLLFSLIMIYLRLDVGRAPVSPGLRLLAHLPFSVYLGWISVATVANVTAVLVDRGWNGFGLPEEIWAVVVIIVAVILALVFIARRRDPSYALVILWALTGIVVARLQGTPPSRPIAITAAVGGVVIVLRMLWSLARPAGG